MDRRVAQIYREFILDPENIELARRLLFLMRRLQLELPKGDDLDSFCKSHKGLKTWLTIMDYGDPSKEAYLIATDKRSSVIPSEKKWLMSVIERDKTGEPSFIAWKMWELEEVSLEWAMSIIENATSGNVLDYAYQFFRDGVASGEWFVSLKSIPE